MLKRCASPKPVLTTYPLPYDGDAEGATLSQERRATLLCTRAARDDAFGADGMLRFRARLLERQPCSPLPTAFWAAGFSFSASSLVREACRPASTHAARPAHRRPSSCDAPPLSPSTSPPLHSLHLSTSPPLHLSTPPPLCQVPYDPHLPFLFFGEEVSPAARGAAKPTNEVS